MHNTSSRETNQQEARQPMAYILQAKWIQHITAWV